MPTKMVGSRAPGKWPATAAAAMTGIDRLSIALVVRPVQILRTVHERLTPAPMRRTLLLTTVGVRRYQPPHLRQRNAIFKSWSHRDHPLPSGSLRSNRNPWEGERDDDHGSTGAGRGGLRRLERGLARGHAAQEARLVTVFQLGIAAGALAALTGLALWRWWRPRMLLIRAFSRFRSAHAAARRHDR